MPQLAEPAPPVETPPPSDWPRHDLWTAELLELVSHAARDYKRSIRPAEPHPSP